MKTKRKVPVKRGFSGTANGRIELLGGIAGCSGSWVLPAAIRQSTKVTVRPLSTPEIRFSRMGEVSLVLGPKRLLDSALLPDGQIRAAIDEQALPEWIHIPLGCLLLLIREKGLKPPTGLEVEIHSTLEERTGTASETALAVATLRALSALGRLKWKETEFTTLCHRVGKQIAGLRSELADALGVAHGKPGTLTPILCQPDILADNVPLPRGTMLAGWSAGVACEGFEAAYETARCAAFMGKKILDAASGHERDYLSDIAPSSLSRYADALLPESISGREFLKRYPGELEPQAVVNPKVKYPVRQAVQFAVEENMRVQLAVSLLVNGPEALPAVGELMLQSHVATGKLGLGMNETDEMVDAVMQLDGVHGARANLAGGPVVVVLLEKQALPILEKLARSLFFAERPLPLIL